MFFSFPFLCVLCSLHLYFPVLFCFICVSSFLVSQSVYFLFYFKHTFSTAFLCFYFPSLFFFVLCLFCFLLFNYWQSAVPQSQLRGHHKNFYTERHCHAVMVQWYARTPHGVNGVGANLRRLEKKVYSFNQLYNNFFLCMSFQERWKKIFPFSL